MTPSTVSWEQQIVALQSKISRLPWWQRWFYARRMRGLLADYGELQLQQRIYRQERERA